MSHIASGQAAAILGITEPRLSELVRQGRIEPRPPVVAGRRLWSLEHVLKAAGALGRDGGPVAQAYLEAAREPGVRST